jgi:hypothetical protein
MLPNSDKNGRPVYPGEYHVVLKLANGMYGVANFVGPGTEVVKRLRRGDVPRTKADMLALLHDIDYVLASGLGNVAEQMKKVRASDIEFLHRLYVLEKSKGDDLNNIMLCKIPIRKKIMFEDYGIISKVAFLDKLCTIEEDDKIILQNIRSKILCKFRKL